MVHRDALLFLLLLGAANTAIEIRDDFGGSKGLQTDQTVITDSLCRIPCKVKYNGVMKDSPISAKFFNVSWSFKPRSERSYHPLPGTPYWTREHNMSFSISDPHCRAPASHTEGPLPLDCHLEVANCDTKSSEQFRGQYKCLVRHRITGATFEVTSELKLTVEGDPNSDQDQEPACYHPDAVNISAQEAMVNSTKMITVHWNSTTRPSGTEYCHGSRRYSVFAVMFGIDELDSHEDNGETKDVPTIFYRNTSQPRDTHFTIPGPIQRDMYYIFQIQNKYKNAQPRDVYNHFASPIFYFGEQRGPFFQDSSDVTLFVRMGDNVNIECEAGGSPPPQVQLIRNGRVLGVLTETGFQLRAVTVSEVGDYYCSASTIHVNPPLGKRRLTVNKKVTIQLLVPLGDNVLTEPCQPYNGGMCRNYIHEDTNVLVSGDAATLEGTISQQVGSIGTYAATHRGQLGSPHYIEAAITEEAIDQCYNFIRAVACNTVYPYCDASSTSSVPVPRHVCKHTCDILRGNGPCSFFLDPSLLDEHRYQLSGLQDALFSSCDNRTAPGGDSPECIYLSLHSPAVDGPGDEHLEQVECVKGDGRSYAGHLSRTLSGEPCQSWYSQRPNRHSIVPAHFRMELYGSGFSCRNPGGLGERPWCYTARGGERWEYCNPPQCETCERYDGHFCSSLSGYRERSVYLNREGWSSVTLGDVEGGMVGLYHSLGGNGLSPACQNALKLLICHGSLPFCKAGGALPLPSCVDHCTLVDEMSLVCPVRLLSELFSRWRSPHRVSRLIGPDCALSAADNDCMPSPPILTTQAVSECFNSSDNGQSYHGDHSHTISDLPCSEWSATNTSFTGTRYPELVGAGDKCRNPGQWGKAPWCINNEGQAELCLVTSCSIAAVEVKSPPSNAGSVVAPLILVAAFVIVFAIAGAVLVVMVRRHYKKQTTGNSPHLQSIGNDSVKNVKFRDNNNYPRLQLLAPKVATAIASFKQIPKSDIEYVKQLGQGFFGMVFKGKMQPLDSEEPDMYVAVKTLKEDSNDGIEAFVNEAKLMFGFDHENIVKILGVSMTQSPYYLVFEYMDKGDLAKFLRENASSLQRRYMNPLDRPRSRTESTLSDDPASLNQEQLLDICKQIVQGMEYLSGLNYVHRDLACRNCLVSSLPVNSECSATPSKVLVKIGDFGLSHNLYSKDYYRVRGQAVLPIRWMSPEAIIYGKFSTAGDVWSFGVVMWEVFTLGMQPYYGTSNEEVMERVRHGKVLQKPTDCSDRIYAIMHECWTQDDQSRPSFSELHHYLNECRVSTSSEYDAMSVYSDTSDISSDAFLEENSDPETEIQQ